MKQKYKWTVLIVLFFSLSSITFAQQQGKQTKSPEKIFRTAMSLSDNPVDGVPRKQKIGLIVSGGEKMIPYLLGKVKKGLESNGGNLNAIVLASLGYLASPDDQEVVETFKKMVFERNPYQEDAAEALLRIGGKAALNLLQMIKHGEVDFDVVSFVMERIWELESIDELRISKEKLKKIANIHPHKATRIQAKSAINLVHYILQLRKTEDLSKKYEKLRELVYKENKYFRGAPTGRISSKWALKKILEHSMTQAIPDLERFLKETQWIESKKDCVRQVIQKLKDGKEQESSRKNLHLDKDVYLNCWPRFISEDAEEIRKLNLDTETFCQEKESR